MYVKYTLYPMTRDSDARYLRFYDHETGPTHTMLTKRR